jgi:hypothetical protein
VTASVHDADDPIRETYEEFELEDATVAMISDPEVTNAWIQSDTVEQIVQ